MIMVLAALPLAFFSAAISALETSLFSLSPEQRHSLRRSGTRGKYLDDLLDHPRRTMNAILVADSMANLLLIFCVLVVVTEPAFLPSVPDWLLAAAVFAALAGACELMPKLLAYHTPMFFCLKLGAVAIMTERFLGGLAGWMEKASDKMLGYYSPHGTRAASSLDKDELLTLLDLSWREGSLREIEAKALGEIVKLGQETVTHCMTPRVDAFTAPDDLNNDELATLLRTRRYRRVPVCGETPDDVLGSLDVKKFLLNPSVPYQELVDPPAFVPETMPAMDLLHNFLQRRQTFAMILDEYGGTEGLITISDFVEELFGEEGPGSTSELYIEKIDSQRILANGSVRLDDLADQIGFTPENESVETLGGWITQETGHVPRPGTCVSLGSWTATVRRATRKRVKEILLEKKRDEPEDPA